MRKIIDKIMHWIGYSPSYQIAYYTASQSYLQQKYDLSELKVEKIIYPAEYYDQTIRDIITLNMKEELCSCISENIKILDGFENGNRIFTASIIIAIKK